MDNKAAYTSGDYSSQIRAMDANHYALEGTNVGFTLWTYCTIVSYSNHDWIRVFIDWYRMTTSGETSGMGKT